jgi:hypothetical protein
MLGRISVDCHHARLLAHTVLCVFTVAVLLTLNWLAVIAIGDDDTRVLHTRDYP